MVVDLSKTPENQTEKKQCHLFALLLDIRRAIIGIIVAGIIAIIVLLIQHNMSEKYPPMASQAQTVEKGITELIEKEIRLAQKPIASNVRDVYDEEACLIKKIYGQLYESKGIDDIKKAYEDSDVNINDIQKFNQKVFYLKYDQNKKPVEVIVTYDVFIKYQYQNQVRYEYKTGKELIKAGYSKDRWLINYLYIESE